MTTRPLLGSLVAPLLGELLLEGCCDDVTLVGWAFFLARFLPRLFFPTLVH